MRPYPMLEEVASLTHTERMAELMRSLTSDRARAVSFSGAMVIQSRTELREVESALEAMRLLQQHGREEGK